MSTSNFTQCDEKYIYAIDTTYEDEDGETQYDDYIVNYTVDHISSDLEKYCIKHPSYNFFSACCHCDVPIGSVYVNDDVYFNIFITAGYYSGASVNIEIVNNKDKHYKYIDKVLAQIERIISQYTNVLKRVATFSNGEAIYETVKK